MSDFNDFFVKFPKGMEGDEQYAIEVVNIQGLFKGESKYTIPPYQRPYSWTKKEVKELITDLDKTLKEQKKWFCGPIFTTQESFKDQNHFLLDGQQRMTTIFLILRCLFSVEFLVSKDVFENPQFSNESPETRTSIKDKRILAHKKYNNLQKLILNILTLNAFDEESLESISRSRFLTELTIRDKFESYITKTREINRDNFGELQFVKASKDDKHLPTLKQLNENLEFIYHDFEGRLKKPDGLIALVNLGKHLIQNLMFIKIPLNKKGDVLDIFETLNSRGKPLALTDLIRFKTLKTNLQKHQSERIEKNWSEIFYYSGLLSGLGFFKNTDVFLERFINSISDSSDGEKEDKDRIVVFENKYGNNYEKGVVELLGVLKSWHTIFDLENGIIKNFKDKSKFNSFIHLLEMSLKINVNSQFAFISYLNNMFSAEQYASNKNYKGDFSFAIFQIIKTTFSLTVFHNIRSNTTRRIFIEIAKSFVKKGGTRLWYKNFDDNKMLSELNDKQTTEKALGFKSNFFPSEDYKVKEQLSGIKNIIHSKSTENEEAKYVLSVYHFMVGGSFPTKLQYKKSHLDHIMPQKWFSNECWKEQNKNGKEQLEVAIKECRGEKISIVLKEMLSSESFWSEKSYSDSFVQLIGNKFEILSKTNIEKGNNFWKDCDDNNINGAAKTFLKKSFTDDPNSSFMIPVKPKNVYEYEGFYIKTIVERSEILVKEIIENFDSFVPNLD